MKPPPAVTISPKSTQSIHVSQLYLFSSAINCRQIQEKKRLRACRALFIFQTRSVLTPKSEKLLIHSSFFILHHFCCAEQERTFFTMLLPCSQPPQLKLYFIHSHHLISCSVPNVIDDSRLSRMCLLNLPFHLLPFIPQARGSNAIEKRFELLKSCQEEAESFLCEFSHARDRSEPRVEGDKSCIHMFQRF